jgi:release factor family 3
MSLFLPTHRGGPQTDRNRIRLKNLLAAARQALLTEGGRVGEVDAVLEPARRFLDEMGSWDQPSDGLALFLGPHGLRRFRVPLRLPELVTVGNRFVVRPLLPLLTAGGHFYVLALSQDETRLFEGTRFGLDEVALDGLPLALWLTTPRRRPQVHAFLADRGGAGGHTVFHGGDDAGPKVLIQQHFQRVDHFLRDVLGTGSAPLVLAGVRSMQALYHKVNTYPELLAAGLDGSPRDIDPEELHRRAWPLVEPVLRRDEAVAAGAHRALQGTGRTCTEPAGILTAAQQGRVETLFLSTDTPEWAGVAGRSGVDAGPLIRLGDPVREEEQLDLAAVATLRHGGTVYAVPAAGMPGGDPVAATLRY